VRLGDAFVYQRREASTTPKPVAVAARRPPVARVARAARVEAPTPRRVRALPIEVAPAAQAEHDAAAIVACRKLVYLEPDQPVAYLHLGLALEAVGDARAARRVFTAGRAALDRCDAGLLASSLEGYGVEELSLLLDRKMVDPS
jgi:hypothetical protein